MAFRCFDRTVRTARHLLVGVLTLAAACSSGGTAPTGPPSPTAPPTSAPSTTSPGVTPPTTPPPTVVPPPSSPPPSGPVAIRIHGLPEQGVAVELRRAVLLEDLQGRRVARLLGFSIYNSTAQPSKLVLQRGATYFYLDEFRRMLLPLPSQRAADRKIGPVDEPRVAIRLPRSGGRPLMGHWRYASSSPRYDDLVLAQWSGECEVPIAFFFEQDEGDLRPVTGEKDPATAPESFALGWTNRGRAVVYLPQGACGPGEDPPGVYLFREAGEGRLLVRVDGPAQARMWGNTLAD
jgi:hypothetical protein